MSPQGNDRRSGSSSYWLLGGSPGMRAWGNVHPIGLAVVQGLLFAILIGIFSAVTSAHHSLGRDVASAAIGGVVFGLLMWGFFAFLRRRTARG